MLLEDNELDAELIAQELKKSGLDFHLMRIETEVELRRELETHTPDIILSDHGLPTFSGFKALEIVRQTRPALPFVFVSGSNSQQMVVDMFERGATDYVFKKDLRELRAVMQRIVEQPVVEDTLPPQHFFHPELKLDLPAPTTPQPVFSPSLRRLIFCPDCRQARDESGRVVTLENILGTCAETVILRLQCTECAQRERR